MIITDDGDKLVFETTGKVVDINVGIIGLGTDLNVSYGYDGAVHNFDPFYGRLQLSKIEQLELADHMIKQWKAYRNRAVELPR